MGTGNTGKSDKRHSLGTRLDRSVSQKAGSVAASLRNDILSLSYKDHQKVLTTQHLDQLYYHRYGGENKLTVMPSIAILSVDAPLNLPTKGPQPTNTLLITQVPQSFFQPVILEALRDFFALYGEINQWAPLSCFSRIIVVYYSEEAAEQAKRSCDPLTIQPTHGSPTTLRVFRADKSPIITHSPPSNDHFLRPPPLEKNFLISPPGSPPIGWEPIREDPPNTATLAEDLIAALKKLQLRERHGGREVLLEPEEGVGVGVYVEDADCSDSEQGEDDVEVDWEYGSVSPARMRWKPVPTAMPPMPVTLR